MVIQNTNEVPLMTNPLGTYWRQPNPGDIAIDGEYAVMDRATFEMLPEYSATLPSGVYPGKMWRANLGQKWMLRWFGNHENPTLCSNNEREILLV